MVSWEIFSDNPYGLAACSFVVSFIAFYVKYSTKWFRVGFVGLVTYLVVCFGEFLLSHKVILLGKENTPVFSIYELTYKRIVTTSIG